MPGLFARGFGRARWLLISDTMTLAIAGLSLGFGAICYLLWLGAQIRHNTRGHRLGRWMAYHNGTRSRASSWWRI